MTKSGNRFLSKSHENKESRAGFDASKSHPALVTVEPDAADSSSGDARHYYRDGPESLIEQALEGLTLVYHCPSGQTHIIDSPMPEILAVLGSRPQSAEMLLKALAERYDLDADGDAAQELGAHLDALVSLGLARLAP